MSMRQLRISHSITTRESASLEKYLREIGRIDLTPPDEEFELCARTRQGDSDARDRLIGANLRFVVSVAKQYQGKGLSLPDLINEGNIGLVRAAERFDESKGFKFISFAVWWIRQSIMQAITANGRVVRLPLNKIFLVKQIQRTESALEQALDRPATLEEVADSIGIPVEEVKAGQSMGNNTLSLDMPVTDDEDSTLLDTIEDVNAEKADRTLSYDESLRTELDRSMQLLSDRQKQTILYFFGIGQDHPLSLEDIGKKFDLTTERVRQIKDKAITKLRTAKTINLLRSYLHAS